MRVRRPPPVLLVVLVAGILLLALSLAWHLIGMNHGADMGTLWACAAILAAGLAALIGVAAGDATRLTGAVGAGPARVVPLLPAARSRPPPREGTVLHR